MSLRMQLRRGVIALIIGLALGGLAIGRASLDGSTAVRGVGSVIRAVQQSGDCASSLRIDVADAVRVTVPCDLTCAPMRRVLSTLHVGAKRQSSCTPVQTA